MKKILLASALVLVGTGAGLADSPGDPVVIEKPESIVMAQTPSNVLLGYTDSRNYTGATTTPSGDRLEYSGAAGLQSTTSGAMTVSPGVNPRYGDAAPPMW
jgi:hypothetical protein